jgi:hypothetical protein
MKLVEILAKELYEWPIETRTLVQGEVTGAMYRKTASNVEILTKYVFNKAEDVKYAEVTRQQWLEEKEKQMQNKEFTKVDLKTGMRVVYRNSKVGIILKDIGVIALGGGGFSRITEYNSNFIWGENCNVDNSDWDIIKVYGGFTEDSKVLNHSYLGRILWERKEQSPAQKELEALKQKSKELNDQIAKLEKTIS